MSFTILVKDKIEQNQPSALRLMVQETKRCQ